MTKPTFRMLFQAMDNAERVRYELSRLIQPDQMLFDIVTLADEIIHQQEQIKRLQDQLNKIHPKA